VREYGVLEAPRDPVLDGFAALAAHICGTPMAFITLITEDRQVIKAAHGLALSDGPRSHSFCGHAILASDEPFLVPDATADPRFEGIPAVADRPGIRAYGAVALVTPSGHAIGTLCVADRVPRTLGDHHLRALRMLSSQVMGHLEIRRALRQSQLRFELMSHSADAVVWDWDIENDAFWWSDTFAAVFGHPAGTLRDGKRAWQKAVHPDDRELAIKSVKDAWERGADQWVGEYRFARADGTYVIVHDRAAILRNASGTAIRMSGEMRDITKSRHSADMLTLLSAAVEQSADLVMITDRACTIQYVNAAFECHTGFSRKEAVGKSPRIIKSGAHDPEFYSRMMARINAGLVFRGEFINRRKNGELYTESKTITPIKNTEGEIIHFLSAGRDVSEQRRAEEELRSKTAFFEAQLNSTLSGIVLADHNGRIVFSNKRFAEIWKVPLGVLDTPEEARHLALIAEMAKDPERFNRLNDRVLAEPLEPSRNEVELKDGTVVDCYASPVIGKDGSNYGRIWKYHDITPQKRALKELAESLALLDSTLESTVDGILVANGKGELTKFNRKFIEMWSLPPEIVASKDDEKALNFVLAQLTDPDAFVRKVRELYAHPDEESFDVLEFKDGRVFERYSQPHRIGDEVIGRVWSFRDVSERRKLESRLLRTQRMESIGTLAGGVAHDLNNVLAPILISIELLKADSQGDPEQAKVIDAIRTSAQRGASLVRQVLTFARGFEGQKTAVDLSVLLVDFESLVRETFPRNIRIVSEAPTGLWRVTGDPTQLHQVLLNLAVNARDAMPTGGVLSILATNQLCDEASVLGHPEAKPGKFVRIAVDDTGHGIAPHIRDRVFEPFFTTKEVGKGTGLGLATVYAIVKSHGGFVTVSSKVGDGTTFIVHLPAEDRPAPVKPEAPAASSFYAKGQGETILVVDDEEPICRVLKRTLERCGYRVVTAFDGAKACDYYAQNWREVSLVLTDMMMPVMDGAATISTILSINPRARVIASSGLHVTENIAKAQSLGVRDFLSKPYEAAVVLGMVREALDRPLPR
jgi:PAS domain S-box-containing protein